MPRLCKTCAENDRWLPVSVDTHRAFLGKLIVPTPAVLHADGLKSNLAYNLQYLEYLDFTLQDLRLTSVLRTITTKNFLIVGTSVIEAILYYVLRAKSLHRENNWQLLRKVVTNEFAVNSDTCKIENHFFQKLPAPVEEEMTFDSMLKKVETKKLLGNDEALYKKLNYLRKLRNRVHLQLLEKNLDTDWHNFNDKEFLLMKQALYAVFSSTLFSPTTDEIRPMEFLNAPDP
jgi:hypothetical protein